MEKTIFYPVIAQGALAFAILLLLAYRRLTAIAAGQSDMKYFLVFAGVGEPEHVTAVQRSLHNQFEMPVLFYVACILAAIFSLVDSVLVYAAWVYVATRYLHALVHVTVNIVLLRFWIFVVSNLVLLFIWVWLAL